MKVTTYNSVDIHMTNGGVFYCNPSTNSDSFHDASIRSEKLEKVKTAIESFKGYLDPYEVYHLNNNNVLTKLTVVNKTGTRLYFDNGKTSDTIGGRLFPFTIDSTESFDQIVTISKRCRDIEALISELSREKYSLNEAINTIAKKLPKL